MIDPRFVPDSAAGRRLVIFMVVLSICAFGPSGSAENVPPQDSNWEDWVTRQPESVTVPFVTLRHKTGKSDPAEVYDGSRGEPSAGICTVSFAPIWGLEDIAQSAPFYIPDEKIVLDALEERSIEDLLAELDRFSDRDSGNLVIYIHGFNIDFDKGCRRSAIFQRALGLDERLLLFSWPADGNMLKYTWDEADLVWSVPHIADFLERLSDRVGAEKIDLVAHSLGARGAVQALVRLAYGAGESPLINELVLIAPDIDADIFRQEFTLLSRTAARTTVYVSNNDKALKLSQEIHGYPSLGQAGENLSVIDGVETIDISGINSRRLSGHLYHLFDPEVIDDLTLLLHSGKPAAERPALQAAEKNGLPYWVLTAGD